jgi:DNA-binding beta-propeller fold protein YncE
MFIVGLTNDTVYQYSLSTGFDVSTASYDSVSFSVASQDGSPFGLAFNSDGTKMFIVAFTGDAVYEYTLSTGFNVSTASFVDSFSVASQETLPQGLAFNSDGTKMFIVGQTNDTVYQYNLSTGFDVSTATYSQNFDISSQDTNPRGISFNTDGTKMFVAGY